MKKLILSIISMIIGLSCYEPIGKNETSYLINSNIKGKAFLNGNHTSEEYSPRGSFIVIIPSRHRFWRNVQLFQNGKQFMGKDFYVGKEATILFDSLSNGEYKLKFISYFNDEVEEKIDLKERLKKEFPEKLSYYYEEITFDNFSIGQVKIKDTLQILYQEFGCFSIDQKLIEFAFDEPNTKVRISDWGNNWEEIKIESPIDTLNKLIKGGKEINGKEGCSNYTYYTFRKKGGNILSIIKDGSCNWRGIRMISKKRNPY